MNHIQGYNNIFDIVQCQYDGPMLIIVGGEKVSVKMMIENPSTDMYTYMALPMNPQYTYVQLFKERLIYQLLKTLTPFAIN